MTESPILEVDRLSKRFGQLTAVDSVSFNVAGGELFAFLGPNGAGKTTTINMLCTLFTPSGGRATVNGYDVVTQRSDVRRLIGLIFQDPTLDEYLTAEQNLRFHAYAYRIPKSICEQRIDELLTLVELSDRRRSRVRTFSGGMKRRLEIARGLLHSPRVLFLDEPTLGLDPQTRRHIWQYILTLRAQHGLTIFLTTHYMDEAEVADRIGIIDHGHLVALDTPGHLKDALGGDVITLEARDNAAAMAELRQRFNVEPVEENGALSFSVPHGDRFLPRLIRALESPVLSVGLRRPTLEDVFLRLTGHAIRQQEADPMAEARAFMSHRRRGGHA